MNYSKTLSFLLAISTAAATASCTETTSSQNIKTSGIVADVVVTATNDSESKVTVTLKVGGRSSNTFVDLEGGDRLYASADGQERELKSEGPGEYEAKFDTAEEDAEFTITLERDWDESAKNSTGKLPAPFDITSNFGSDPISRADDDMTVTWEPADSNDDMEIDVEADDIPSCLWQEDFDMPGDSGEYMIEAGELRSKDEDDPDSCDAVLTVTRQRNGKIDSKFDSDSRFRLFQVRSARFVSAP